MDDLVCPKCKDRSLHMHTTLVHAKSGAFEDVHYEWECSWCGHRFGDYTSVTEAQNDYNEKYGGKL